MEEVFRHTATYEPGQLTDQIKALILMATAMQGNEASQLTDKEMELLVEFTRQYYMGLPIGSPTSIEIVSSNTSFSFKDHNIYVYRKRLVDKGWLQKNGVGYDIVPFLKLIDTKAEGTEITVIINNL